VSASPRVSVVMSVHNGARHLSEALAGIFDQTCTDFEFLVIDDGSADETPQVLAAVNDPRMRVIRQQQMGLTRSLIKAMSLARGEYVARQDADDVSMAGRLEQQAEFLETHPEVALVGSAVIAITEDGNRIAEYPCPTRHCDLVAQLNQARNPLPHTSYMLRRAAVLKVGGYREVFRKAQDYDLLLRTSEHFGLASIAEPLCKLRLVSDSVTAEHAAGEQFEYTLMALAAALIRRQTGIDPLQTPARDGFVRRFRLWYKSGRHSMRFNSQLLRRQFRIALAQRKVLEAFSCLIKATTADPGWPIERARNRFDGRSRARLEVAAWVRNELQGEA
jgi:glycosyltransferase involved in cell wall biosynthesis